MQKPSREIKVGLPWASANFISLNGFHPLYAFLLNSAHELDGIQFVTFETSLWYDLLHKPDNRQALTSLLETFNQKHRAVESTEASEFWTFFNFNEAILDELSGIDIKLVHTAPVWAGEKPFIYHLESFETVFYPWTLNDPFLLRTPAAKIRRLRQFLLNVFESPRCLAIVSHVSRTLERFRQFFQSEKVNEKLHHCPVGFDVRVRPPRQQTNLRFLFSSSFHGSLDNVSARGLFTVLKFVSKWQETHPEDEFVFLCPKPESLLGDMPERSAVMGVLHSPNVIFLDGQFLDTVEFDRLLVSCDFILIPSYRLHTATILRSMAMGVIPVVTDLPELADYRITDDNAVVLDIFAKASTTDSEVFGPLVPLPVFLEHTTTMAEQMAQKMSALRVNPQQRRSIATKAQSHVQQNFSSVGAGRRMSELIAAVSDRYLGTLASNGEDWSGKSRFGPIHDFLPEMRPVCANDFNQRPRFSTQLDIGSVVILSNGSNALTVAKGTQLSPRSWSFLTAIDNGFTPVDKFSTLRFPSTWWEAVDAGFELLLKAGSGAAPTLPPLTRSIASQLNRLPYLKQALVRLGVHKIAPRIGYGKL